MNCPHCQSPLPENNPTGTCPACGRTLTLQSKSHPTDINSQDKSFYWVMFWIAFLGAPAMCLLAVPLRTGGAILFLPFLGAIVAGFSLARVFSKTAEAFVVTGVLLTVGVLVIYVGILFIGCVVALGHGGGF
jgi:predicted amidophosphoribosyltransferase